MQVFLVGMAGGTETFAMKQVICQSQDTVRDVEIEVHVHQAVRHPNVMQLIDFLDTRRNGQREVCSFGTQRMAHKQPSIRIYKGCV